MSAGDITQGRRADDSGHVAELQPGEYCVRVDAADGERVAWVVTPNGHGPSRLKGWCLVEHNDGTITTSPSILAHPIVFTGDEPDVGGWHGYLERGVWREV